MPKFRILRLNDSTYILDGKTFNSLSMAERALERYFLTSMNIYVNSAWTLDALFKMALQIPNLPTPAFPLHSAKSIRRYFISIFKTDRELYSKVSEYLFSTYLKEEYWLVREKHLFRSNFAVVQLKEVKVSITNKAKKEKKKDTSV